MVEAIVLPPLFENGTLAMTERRLPAVQHAWTLTGLIALAIAMVTLTRLMPYWLGQEHAVTAYLWNFTQVPALLLFGVALFRGSWIWLAFILPLLTMTVSDAALGALGYVPTVNYASRALVYGTFLLLGCLGFWLRRRRGVIDVVGVSLLSSVLFYLITNFVVWVSNDPACQPIGGYELTFSGLVTCYEMALPWFRNEVLGNLFYCGFLFGTYAVVERWLTSRERMPVTVRA